MGNDESLKKKYTEEKDVSIKISLNKVCYSPNELIKGIVNLKSKMKLNDPIFNDTSATIKIIQMLRCSYHSEDTSDVTESKDVLILDKDFTTFKGSNLLFGINIPFSIKIPDNILPSCYISVGVSETYIKHFLFF